MNRRLSATSTALRGLAPRASFVEAEILGLDAVVRPGDICFDVGAEYGLYTYPLAHLVGPSGLVHSFEPIPGAARVLSAGVGLFGCGNVRRFEAAVGATSGTGELSLPRRRGLPVHGRTFLTTGAQGLGPNTEFATSDLVRTPVTTIDAIYEHFRLPRVDFVKVDVEGAEPQVIDGARHVVETHRPTLLLEIEDRHLAKFGTDGATLAGRLHDLGYRMHIWRSGAWHEVDQVTDEHRNYLFTTRPIAP